MRIGWVNRSIKLHTLLIFTGLIFDWKHRLQVSSVISFLSFVWQSKPIFLSMILYSNAKKGLFVPKFTGCTICKHLFATFFGAQNPRRWRHLVLFRFKCFAYSVSTKLGLCGYMTSASLEIRLGIVLCMSIHSECLF